MSFTPKTEIDAAPESLESPQNTEVYVSGRQESDKVRKRNRLSNDGVYEKMLVEICVGA